MSKELNRLDDMIGRSVVYKNEKMIIHGYSLKEGNVVIKTSNGSIATDEYALPGMLDKMKVQEQVAVVSAEQNKVVNDVRSILVDQIKLIQKDPAYIAQAKEINKTVGVLLSSYKVEIEARKLSNQ